MNILVYYYYGEGGGFTNIKHLIATLAKEHPDDHFTILSHKRCALLNLEAGNMTMRRINVFGPRELGRFIFGIGGLSRVCRNLKPDLVWAINFGSYVNLCVPQLLNVNNSHQVLPKSETGDHPNGAIFQSAMRYFFLRSLKKSAAAIVQTPLMASHLRRLSGCPNRVAVISKAVQGTTLSQDNALPTELESLLKANKNSDTFTFLYVATNPPHKNHAVVIRALKILAAATPQIRVAFSLTRDEILSIEPALGADLIEAGSLIALGWIDPTWLPQLYGRVDGTLMPSKLESLSSAHLESMHYGLPQITSDMGHSREVCGDAAIYVDPDDDAAWASAMTELSANPSLRKSLVLAGKAQIAKFPATWEDVANQLYSFMVEVRTATSSKEEAAAHAAG